MKIRELIWPEDRINHIAQHGVTPAEVEQVCFSNSMVQRARSEGQNPVYYVLGQTDAGRYLFCVIIQFPNNKGYPVTARQMSDKDEHQRNSTDRLDSGIGSVLGLARPLGFRPRVRGSFCASFRAGNGRHDPPVSRGSRSCKANRKIKGNGFC